MQSPLSNPPMPAAEVNRTLLKDGIANANIPALLMVLYQMTGEATWLQEPFAPGRSPGLDDNDSGQLPDEVQTQIRTAAEEAIEAWLAGKPLAIERPTNLRLAEMLSVAMTEHVPEEYGDIVAAGMGYDLEPTADTAIAADKTAIVIGGGVSGICAGIELGKLGIDYTLFEKNEDFGGTWFENRYPGCGVDTPSLTYTFSCRPNDWSMYFPLRDEIEGYLLDTAREFGLYDKARFRTHVEEARWNTATDQWDVTITTPDGKRETHSADYLFSAVGILNIPKFPQIDGLDEFAGEVYHTSRWPAEADLSGKRVAVIGNGASGMQVAPAIADEVSRMTIFARSKQWAAPFPQFRKKVPEGVRYLMQVVPLYRAWLEQRLSWTFNDRVHGTLFRDPEWEHPERAVNEINDAHRRVFTRYVEEQLQDRPELIERVLPEYPPFAKRMLLDNGWFRTIKKPHVDLIPEHLAKVQGNTLFTSSGETVEADVIILATGFQTTNVLGSYDIVGREGQLLRDHWGEDNASAYLGTLVPGFPNFFILLGPNVGSGHGGSMIRNIENQMHFAGQVVQCAEAQEASTVEVKETAYTDYSRRIDDAHDRLVWTHPGTENWYRNSQGRVVAITPWRNDAFWRMTRSPDEADLEFDHRQESSGAA
ncbi:NAD(P)/FAD-dependent oxidoreductase [Qipengyuania flava]|nr:NAD(P)/FAD-dependent oxidoreductase [Qipengyuania flava]MBY5965320.1 NAD(P)/FAD-dependent oxidoreductase [Qipengyuania flava]MBY6011644.1 NAD(P)/FAD-dependent oxidoreductase [Qipengyuania flava]MBY6026086.1 NAD(P)/FAD-dependent oxidoreductase [Qipengyuania flava]